MTATTGTGVRTQNLFASLFLLMERAGNLIPDAGVGLFIRLSVAYVFWNSGRNKVTGFVVNDSTFLLFREEFKLPLIPPDMAAYIATISEHVFPLMLFAGFLARLGAAALLGMTLVIQIFVYPDAWPTHALWASALIYVVARGPGAISLDYLIRRKIGG